MPLVLITGPLSIVLSLVTGLLPTITSVIGALPVGSSLMPVLNEALINIKNALLSLTTASNLLH